MEPTKVLVTGGAGFIGSHLVERLLAMGCEVVVVDNFFTGNQNNLTPHEKLTLLCLDVRNITLAQHIVEEYGPFKYIFNLACPASPVHYQRDPIYTTMTSINGILFCTEAAEFQRLTDDSIPRIIQASTSEIYGDPLVHPQPETYFGNVNTLGPRACYDEGKRAAETLCADYVRERGLNIGIVRIFNTYGPRMAIDDGRVVSNFICAALRKNPIEVYGSGEQSRSFCYVDDLVSGLICFAGTNISGPVNLGNPREFTINELAEQVLLKVDGNGIIYKDALQDDPKQRQPDITLAKNLLNWEPRIELSEGLDKTIEYFKGVV